MQSEKEASSFTVFQRRAELLADAQRLKEKMCDSQLHKFQEELRNRSRVLKRLGHINSEGVVQLKGRAACLIDTADELLITELMFNGMVFSELECQISPLVIVISKLSVVNSTMHFVCSRKA
jgi:ATP-dependent RNA helicase DOB1